MSNPAEPLTDDPIALQAMLAAERAENERLRQIIRELQRHRFGRRAESLPIDQLLLGLEEAEQIEAENFAREDTADPAKREARTRKRRANRGSLPAHLPRIEQVIDIPDKVCPCCRGMLHVMGEDVAERLDIVPAQFHVIVTGRPKYACRSCEEVVVQAPAPSRLVEGGIPTEATVAHVLVSKYADHLPLYRQSQIYARQGVNLDRSTLADWVGKAAFLLRPIHERLFERLKASGKLFADETTAPVLDPGRGRTKTGQLFAYARDDRPWGGIDPPGVAYIYAPDRKAEQPLRHLQGFVGILQVDGYAGYKALAERNAVSLAFCWAHVRRRFYELAQSGPAPIATETLARIAELYKIESEIRGRSPEERRTARQERSRPIIEALELWLCGKLALVSQKSKLAEAIRYALSRWAGLGRFLDDGRVEIDSNLVERSIRPIALNRKNALFAGSDGGGEHWATIASLIETAKLNGVDPFAYLPTSSPASSPVTRRTRSTTCCHGPMPQRHSRPWLENSGYSESMSFHDTEVMEWLEHRSRRRLSFGRVRCGMRRRGCDRCFTKNPPLIRWSIQEIRRIAIRLARRRIRPAHIIAWSLWRRAHQATARQAHLK